jgi:hypothetical protein
MAASPQQGQGQGWPALNRVKVYKLSDESGQWTDKGTGFINVEYMEVSEPYQHCLRSALLPELNLAVHAFMAAAI